MYGCCMDVVLKELGISHFPVTRSAVEHIQLQRTSSQLQAFVVTAKANDNPEMARTLTMKSRILGHAHLFSLRFTAGDTTRRPHSV